MKASKNITNSLSAYQKCNLNKVTDNYEETCGYPPKSVEVIKGIVCHFVVCNGYNGDKVIYTTTSHLNIKSKKTYNR